MKEEWRIVPNFEGILEVSDLGRARTLDRIVDTSRNGIKGRLQVWGRDKAIHRERSGYTSVSIGSRRYMMHRLVAAAFIEDFHPECTIDHIDRDRTNSKLSNLRIASKAGNSQNSSFTYGVSTYKGITKKSANKYWNASITSNRVEVSLGYYNTEVEAALAYNIAALELHGEYACLNDLSHIPDLPDRPLRRTQKKKVVCLNSGEIYESASEAERRLGLSPGSVIQICRGRAKQTKGLKFKYITEEL